MVEGVGWLLLLEAAYCAVHHEVLLVGAEGGTCFHLDKDHGQGVGVVLGFQGSSLPTFARLSENRQGRAIRLGLAVV